MICGYLKGEVKERKKARRIEGKKNEKIIDF